MTLSVYLQRKTNVKHILKSLSIVTAFSAVFSMSSAFAEEGTSTPETQPAAQPTHFIIKLDLINAKLGSGNSGGNNGGGNNGGGNNGGGGDEGSWVHDGYIYSEWESTGDIDNCTFEGDNPTAAICDYWQSRTITERERHTITQATRLGNVDYEYRSVRGGDTLVSVEETEWTDWWFDRESDINGGASYTCEEWSPLPETMPLGQEYIMTRDCLDTYIRTKSIVYRWASGRTEFVDFARDEEVRASIDTKPAVGRMDYVIDTRQGPWQVVTENADCTTWMPTAESRTNFDPFTQNRSCNVTQSSRRENSNIWRSGMITPAADAATNQQFKTEVITRNEERPIVINETGWYTTAVSGCSEWLPSTDGREEHFLQYKTCNAQQSRTLYFVADVYPSETIRQASESRVEPGAYIESRLVYFGMYEIDDGAPHSCSSWTPTVETQPLGVGFNQTRICTQNTKVIRTYSTGTSTQTPSSRQIEQQKFAYGTFEPADPLVDTIRGEWGPWYDNGWLYACSGWAPWTGSFDWGTPVTISQTCYQDQIRSRSVTLVYQSGKTVSGVSESETQTIPVIQTFDTVGTKDGLSHIYEADWSPWNNKGSVFNCSEYLPPFSTVDHGVAFTQSSNCSQEQERVRAVYEVSFSGRFDFLRNETETQTISVTQDRPAIGTKSTQVVVVGEEIGPWSAWGNSGDVFNCGEWTPEAITVEFGQSFQQSATCDQNQNRSRTIYDVWSNNTKTVQQVQKESQIISLPQTKNAVGTKKTSVSWVWREYGPWSSWADHGDVYACGVWSPDASTVGSGFPFKQKSMCSQGQVRNRTVYDVWSDGSKTVNSIENENQVISKETTKDAIGTAIGGSDPVQCPDNHTVSMVINPDYTSSQKCISDIPATMPACPTGMTSTGASNGSGSLVCTKVTSTYAPTKTCPQLNYNPLVSNGGAGFIATLEADGTCKAPVSVGCSGGGMSCESVIFDCGGYNHTLDFPASLWGHCRTPASSTCNPGDRLRGGVCESFETATVPVSCSAGYTYTTNNFLGTSSCRSVKDVGQYCLGGKSLVNGRCI